MISDTFRANPLFCEWQIKIFLALICFISFFIRWLHLSLPYFKDIFMQSKSKYQNIQLGFIFFNTAVGLNGVEGVWKVGEILESEILLEILEAMIVFSIGFLFYFYFSKIYLLSVFCLIITIMQPMSIICNLHTRG